MPDGRAKCPTAGRVRRRLRSLGAHLWPVTETSARCLVLAFATAVRMFTAERVTGAAPRPPR